MKEKIRKKVEEIFKNNIEKDESIFLEEIENGIYYAGINTTRKGPGSLIIGDDLSYLYKGSAVGYDELLKMYKEGKRTQE